jgi:hypothetical protein
MANLIKFIPQSIGVKETEPAPLPAYRFIPKWFKDLKPEKESSHLPLVSRIYGTVKKCVPFIDSLTAGYMVILQQDLEVKNIDGNQHIYWVKNRLSNEAIIEPDELFRVGEMPFPKGFSRNTWRYNAAYKTTTPKGYSLLVTHPLNRFDLPFQTVSGIIDTDTFCANLIITFVLQDSFVGVLEKGTPIAQLIPIKRDSWVSKTSEPLTDLERYSLDFKILSSVKRSYQTLFWQKKSYK